jgi:hypothetical protein
VLEQGHGRVQQVTSLSPQQLPGAPFLQVFATVFRAPSCPGGIKHRDGKCYVLMSYTATANCCREHWNGRLERARMVHEFEHW